MIRFSAIPIYSLLIALTKLLRDELDRFTRLVKETGYKAQ